MAMILYEGKAIAFGPSEEIFARVRSGNAQAAAATKPAPAPVNAKPVGRAQVAESIPS
jgi:hypothetical protein